jgi:hypothetical protein
MIRRHDAVLVVLMSIAPVLAVLGSAGCEDNPVGRLCDLGSASPPPPGTNVIASPSLDCVSRTCLLYPPAQAMCTAECSTADDCDRVPESPCLTGFTCGVAVTVGSFCCRKFCICKDFIVLPESGELAPEAGCKPEDPNNACCNLPGRTNNPDPRYKLCKS